jgi:hypothetical protein
MERRMSNIWDIIKNGKQAMCSDLSRAKPNVIKEAQVRAFKAIEVLERENERLNHELSANPRVVQIPYQGEVNKFPVSTGGFMGQS